MLDQFLELKFEWYSIVYKFWTSWLSIYFRVGEGSKTSWTCDWHRRLLGGGLFNNQGNFLYGWYAREQVDRIWNGDLEITLTPLRKTIAAGCGEKSPSHVVSGPLSLRGPLLSYRQGLAYLIDDVDWELLKKERASSSGEAKCLKRYGKIDKEE